MGGQPRERVWWAAVGFHGGIGMLACTPSTRRLTAHDFTGSTGPPDVMVCQVRGSPFVISFRRPLHCRLHVLTNRAQPEPYPWRSPTSWVPTLCRPSDIEALCLGMARTYYAASPGSLSMYPMKGPSDGRFGRK